MSLIGKIGAEIRDQSVSFGIAAVPAFLGTAFLGGMFSLGMGLGAAAGLPGGLTVLTGMLLAGVTLGVSAGVGIVLGMGGLFGAAAVLDAVPVLRDARVKGLGVTAGIVAGVGASIAMAFSLAAGDPEVKAPETAPQAALVQPAPQVAGLTSDARAVFSIAGFGDAANSVPVSPVKVLPPAHVFSATAAPSF